MGESITTVIPAKAGIHIIVIIIIKDIAVIINPKL
jgi:hypothetical protein